MKPESPTENFVKLFDSPWLQSQVQTHLFFGDYKGKYYFFAAIAVYIAMWIMLLDWQDKSDLLSLLMEPRVGAFTVLLILAILFGNYKTNALLWAAVKFTVLFASFICILVGAVNTLRHDPADVELIILGLLWFPGLEFVKRLTEKQKYITLVRVFITVPIVLILQ